MSKGGIYEGDWLDGKLTGKGKYTWSNGNVYFGDFVNFEFSGIGKITYADGDWFEGQFKNDKKNGLGKLYNSKTRKITRGRWKNDEQIKKL